MTHNEIEDICETYITATTFPEQAETNCPA
jgi:hypothetical protein